MLSHYSAWTGSGCAFEINAHVETPYLDAHRLLAEVDWGAQGAGPGVEVQEGGSCQGQQGDDGWGRQRGEQQLEEEFHDAGTHGRRRTGKHGHTQS